MTQPEQVLQHAIDEVVPVETKWTVGRIITKEQPTPGTVRLRLWVEGRQRQAPGQHYLIRLSPDPPIGGWLLRVVTRECPCGAGGLDLLRV